MRRLPRPRVQSHLLRLLIKCEVPVVRKWHAYTFLPTRSSVICRLESRPLAVGGKDTATGSFAHPWCSTGGPLHV